LNNPKERAMDIRNLRVEIPGLSINDYRVSDRDLEFRALDNESHPFPDQRGKWRRLTANELVLHFRLKTIVGIWFLEKVCDWETELADQKVANAA